MPGAKAVWPRPGERGPSAPRATGAAPRGGRADERPTFPPAAPRAPSEVRPIRRYAAVDAIPAPLRADAHRARSTACSTNRRRVWRRDRPAWLVRLRSVKGTTRNYSRLGEFGARKIPPASSVVTTRLHLDRKSVV